MKNKNNPVEIDNLSLLQIFRILFNSKLLIIAFVLPILAISFIYANNRPEKPITFSSSALIKLGWYENLNGEVVLLNSQKNLRNELMIKFYNNLNNISDEKISFKSKEDSFIEINTSTDSKTKSLSKLEKVLDFIKNKNSKIITNLKLNTADYIDNIAEEKDSSLLLVNRKVENIETTLIPSLIAEKDQKILTKQREIDYINNFILPNFEQKIIELEKVIKEDSDNLELIKSIPKVAIQRAAIPPTMEEIIYSYRLDKLDLQMSIFDYQYQLINLNDSISAISTSYDLKLKEVENEAKVFMDSVNSIQFRFNQDKKLKQWLLNDIYNDPYIYGDILTVEKQGKLLNKYLFSLITFLSAFIFICFSVLILHFLKSENNLAKN
jgi:hypothetical protein